MIPVKKARTTENLNLRWLPEVKPETKIILMNQRTEVTLYDGVDFHDGNRLWQFVSTGSGQRGWCATEFLELILPPSSRPRTSSPIGIHCQQPMHPHQRQAIIDLYARMHAIGKPIPVFLCVNDPQLIRDVKRVSPSTYCIYRYVKGKNDRVPINSDPATGDYRGIESGQSWFDIMWPSLSEGHGADCFQFTNEWYSKEWMETIVTDFGNFYADLADVCWKRGVVCTLGDFSMGTPEPYHLDNMSNMWDRAIRYQFPVNYHSYSANNAAGHKDLAAGAEWFFMRWEMIAAIDPRITIVGGEVGNSGMPNLFIPETPALMRQGANLLVASKYERQYKGGCWWEVVAPEKEDFGPDDFTPILPQMEADLKAW